MLLSNAKDWKHLGLGTRGASMEVPSRIWFKNSEGVVLGRIPPNADEKLTDSEKSRTVLCFEAKSLGQKIG